MVLRLGRGPGGDGEVCGASFQVIARVSFKGMLGVDSGIYIYICMRAEGHWPPPSAPNGIVKFLACRMLNFVMLF